MSTWAAIYRYMSKSQTKSYNHIHLLLCDLFPVQFSKFLEQSTSLELPELDNTLAVHCDGLPVHSTGGDTSDRVLMRRPLSMLVAAAM